ncbi:MAG TPA: lectin [Luteimonas sp.]|nr:lectin [Luteimonas sp.]
MNTIPMLAPLLAVAVAACDAQAPGEPRDAQDAPATQAPQAPADAQAPSPPRGPGDDVRPSDPQPPPQLLDEPRFDGYGPLRFGMTEEAAKRAWPGELRNIGGQDHCHYLQPETGHALAWLGFMVEGGQFVRYDVGNPELVAPGGGKVGMSADEIRALYPDRVTSLPHHYVPGGEYLRVPAEQGEGFLVFETDADGTVTTWRGGLSGPVGYIEGCA